MKKAESMGEFSLSRCREKRSIVSPRWLFFRRSWRLGVLAVIPGFAVALMVSCSAQKIPQTPAGAGTVQSTPGAVPTHNPFLGTALAAGEAAVVGFTVHGTQNDQFAF